MTTPQIALSDEARYDDAKGEGREFLPGEVVDRLLTGENRAVWFEIERSSPPLFPFLPCYTHLEPGAWPAYPAAPTVSILMNRPRQ